MNFGGHQWRIHDFPEAVGRGASTPKMLLFSKHFAKNCMKLKEFGSPGRGRIPRASQDLPLKTERANQNYPHRFYTV